MKKEKITFNYLSESTCVYILIQHIYKIALILKYLVICVSF